MFETPALRFVVPAVVACMAAALAAPAEATFPGGDGKLVFAGAPEPTGPLNVFTVDPDGANRQQTIVTGSQPRWSPDGRRIAFMRIVGLGFDSREHVFVANADGTDEVDLTEGFDPAWSPDGKRLAFIHRPFCFRSGPPCEDSEIWTIGADGTGLARVTDDSSNEFGVDWSPDGSKLVFDSGLGGADIYTINPDGSDLERLTDDPASDINPSWSPDGSRIAFSSGRDQPLNCGLCNYEIYVMQADGNGESRLTIDPAIDGAIDEQPAWSPSGEQIAFTRFVCPPPGAVCPSYWIYRMGANGSAVTPVTDGSSFDSSPDWQPLTGPRPGDYKNASQFCKAERAFLGDSVFAQKYAGGANAHGKCTSASH